MQPAPVAGRPLIRLGVLQMLLRIGKETRVPVAAQAFGLALLAMALLAACSPKAAPPAPPRATPSKVVTTEGVEYYVWGLRLAGTSQEVVLRTGGAQTWVPLSLIRHLRFSGPEKEGYRPAEIVLTSGEKFRGEVFARQLLQGTTDVGYWNMPLAKVKQLAMGAEY
jgi:hypothetical protein